MPNLVSHRRLSSKWRERSAKDEFGTADDAAALIQARVRGRIARMTKSTDVEKARVVHEKCGFGSSAPRFGHPQTTAAVIPTVYVGREEAMSE